MNNRIGKPIMDTFIDALSWNDTIEQIVSWGNDKKSKYVCICNVHSLVTARRNPDLHRSIRKSSMSTPDGMPLVWQLRRHGFNGQMRINGPDLMFKYCQAASKAGQSVYFYGSTTKVLASLESNLSKTIPDLRIAGSFSPPFRDMTPEEDEDIVRRINETEPAVVFVGLGCPKQELWMEAHLDRVNAVMIGVGAAFDFHAGLVRRAPRWMQVMALEWLHRLSQEPDRLLWRYLTTNLTYLLYMLGDGPSQRVARIR